MKKKILFVFGTRPEIIKLFPVISEFKNNSKFITKIFNTQQHVEILLPLLKTYSLKVDYISNVKNKNITLSKFSSKLLSSLDNHFSKHKYDYVFVLGDTATAFMGAQAAYNNKIKVAYIESGLRTYNHFHPWPEESYRRMISVIANINFAPSTAAAQNLISEKISRKTIHVVGNPVIDCIKKTLEEKLYLKHPNFIFYQNILKKKKLILITMHRRENQNQNLINFYIAIKELIKKNQNYFFLFSVHPSPYLRKINKKYLGKFNKENFKCVNFIDHMLFCYFMSKSELIVSDSGGIQEEAAFLGKPMLLMREYTERSEVINKNVKLSSFEISSFIKDFNDMISIKSQNKYQTKSFPYGKGDASKKISRITLND